MGFGGRGGGYWWWWRWVVEVLVAIKVGEGGYWWWWCRLVVYVVEVFGVGGWWMVGGWWVVVVGRIFSGGRSGVFSQA